MESAASSADVLALLATISADALTDEFDDDDDEETLMQMFLIVLVIQQWIEIEESTPPRPPLVPRLRYRFEFSSQDPMQLFRFSEVELRYIVVLMGEPGEHRTTSGDKFGLLEGMCILTRRLCYPCRWSDLVALFGRSAAGLSRIYNYMLTKVIRKYSHLLRFDVRRFVEQLPLWSAAVAESCPNTYNTVALFLDGTHRRTCRPGPSSTHIPAGITRDDIQRSQYDGRLHRHGQKYHALVAPNGLIVHAFGPVDGRRHDTTVLRLSGLAADQADLSVNGIDYCIYADSAYAITRNMQRPFREPAENTVEARMNTVMARARTVASECGYSSISNSWQTIDWVRQQRIFWTRPSDMYLCAVLFTNIRLCLRRSNVMSEFFNLSDTCPLLNEYLRGDWNTTHQN